MACGDVLHDCVGVWVGTEVDVTVRVAAGVELQETVWIGVEVGVRLPLQL